MFTTQIKFRGKSGHHRNPSKENQKPASQLKWFAAPTLRRRGKEFIFIKA